MALAFGTRGVLYGAILKSAENGQPAVEVWNVDDNVSIATTVIPDFAWTPGLAFSSDASMLVVASSPSDDTSAVSSVILLNTNVGESSRFDLEQNHGVAESIRFSRNSERFAISWSDHSLTCFDLQLNSLCTLVHDEDIKEFSFSPDGHLVATAAFDSRARIWNVDEPRQRELVLVHDGPVLTLDFNRSGDLLATGGFDTRVRVWSTKTGEQVGNSFSHQGVVNQVRFHPYLDELLSVSSDLTARIWRHGPVSQKPNVMIHPDRVWSVQFSNDGTTLLTTSQQGSIHTWNVADGTEQAEPVSHQEHGADLVCARFNPADNNEIVAANLKEISFWSLQDRRRSRETGHFQSFFRQVQFSTDGKYVIAGSDLKQAWLLDLSEEQILAHLIQHPDVVSDVAFHPDNQRFATGCNDGNVRIWNIDGLQQITNPLAHQAMVESIAFSPDGRYLATASRDLSIRIWSTNDWRQVGNRIPQIAFVQSLAFSPDGQLLASASSNGRVQLWDVQTGLPLGHPFAHDVFAASVTFNHDGTVLASGSFDKTARLWKLESGYGAIGKEHLRARVWRTLGAKATDSGDVLALTAEEWDALGD